MLYVRNRHDYLFGNDKAHHTTSVREGSAAGQSAEILKRGEPAGWNGNIGVAPTGGIDFDLEGEGLPATQDANK